MPRRCLSEPTPVVRPLLLTCRSQLLTITSMRLALRGVLVALSCTGACFLAGQGASTKISDAVANLNDHARWGRISEASSLVDPDYREVFLDHHRLWGSDIQLADTEVQNIQLASDSEHASAYVTYSWYAMADMTLHETTLRQVWNARNHSFALASEAVVRGDPSLLSPPSVDNHGAIDPGPMH
jgi:hypothetical protein